MITPILLDNKIADYLHNPHYVVNASEQTILILHKHLDILRRLHDSLRDSMRHQNIHIIDFKKCIAEKMETMQNMATAKYQIIEQ